MLTAGALAQTKFLMAGLQVNVDRMARNLTITKGLVVSEAVMMALGPKLGRQRAHDLVYDYCRKAIEEDTMLFDVLVQDEQITGVCSKEELAKLCDPANYLGLSDIMVDRVLRCFQETK